MPCRSKGLLIPFHIPKTNKTFSGEEARTRSRTRDLKPMVIVVLYTDLTFQLPPTLTRGMWLAAKDHLKINEGEVKGIFYARVAQMARAPVTGTGLNTPLAAVRVCPRAPVLSIFVISSESKCGRLKGCAVD